MGLSAFLQVSFSFHYLCRLGSKPDSATDLLGFSFLIRKIGEDWMWKILRPLLALPSLSSCLWHMAFYLATFCSLSYLTPSFLPLILLQCLSFLSLWLYFPLRISASYPDFSFSNPFLLPFSISTASDAIVSVSTLLSGFLLLSYIWQLCSGFCFSFLSHYYLSTWLPSPCTILLSQPIFEPMFLSPHLFPIPAQSPPSHLCPDPRLRAGSRCHVAPTRARLLPIMDTAAVRLTPGRMLGPVGCLYLKEGSENQTQHSLTWGVLKQKPGQSSLIGNCYWHSSSPQECFLSLSLLWP